MIMEMLGSAQVKEDDEEYQSPLDILFERLEMRNPESIAVKQDVYKRQNLPIHIHLLPIHKAAEPNLFRSVLCHHAKTFPIQKDEPLCPFHISELDLFWFCLLYTSRCV